MIELNNIVKIYNKGKENEFEALHDICIYIKDGEMVAIMGKSGAGKSTLLHILGCIDSYEQGEYCLDDVMIKGKKEKQMEEIRNSQIGIIMQEYALVEDMTVLENVMLPLDFGKKKVKNKNQRCKEVLATVGLQGFEKNRVSRLSGGQKQRVAIARAIVNEPKLVLADEPTGALDSQTSADIVELFRKLNKKGTTIVIITHDPEVASACDRIIEICDGRIEN